MKKTLIIVGSVLAISAVTGYFLYNGVPKVKVIKVDWDSKKVTIEVRGKRSTLDANNAALATDVPIPFSKFNIVFEKAQSNLDYRWMINVEHKGVIYSQSIYVDFKNKKVGL